MKQAKKRSELHTNVKSVIYTGFAMRPKGNDTDEEEEIWKKECLYFCKQ